MGVRIQTGDVEPIRIYALQSDDTPLVGAIDLYVRIRRNSDGFYFDWNDLTFKNSGWTTLNQILTQIDATNSPGQYEVTGGFDSGAVTNPNADDSLVITSIQTPGTNANLPGPGEIKVGQWADQISSAATIADAVWDEVIADHVVVGSTGEALSNISAGASPSIIADAVWDEDLTGHATADSAGEALEQVKDRIG